MRSLLVIGILGLTSLVHAQSRVRIVTAPGAICPARDDVARELSSLVPGLVVEPEASTAPVETLVIDGDAQTYRASIGGARRTFADAAHRCVDRARTTAVFAAMSLTPREPDVGDMRAAAPVIMSSAERAEDTGPPGARFNTMLKAGIAVDVIAAAAQAVGGTLYGVGVMNGISDACWFRPCENTARAAHDDVVWKTGLGVGIAGVALGALVGAPLTAIGARRRALEKRHVTVAPLVSGTQVGLATMGTW